MNLQFRKKQKVQQTSTVIETGIRVNRKDVNVLYRFEDQGDRVKRYTKLFKRFIIKFSLSIKFLLDKISHCFKNLIL